MKLQSILLTIAIVAVLSICAGGFVYLSSTRENSFNIFEQRAYNHLENIKNHISNMIKENIRVVRVLADHEELVSTMLYTGEDALREANTLLDLFKEATEANVCYIMNRQGETVASTNRKAPGSFVGKNYSFRRYFKTAMEGNCGIFMAQGVTSGERGVYYSCPIFAEDKEKPVGVAVIKASIKKLENELKLQRYDENQIIVLADPHGVIFVSSKKEWLYGTLWKISDQKIDDIAKSRQFGEGPWRWTGLAITEEGRAADESGNKFLVHRRELDSYPGWSVVCLTNLKMLPTITHDFLLRISGIIVIILCGCIGMVVVVLYHKARSNIAERIKTEEALRENEEKYRLLAETAHEIIMTLDLEGRITYINLKGLEMIGFREKDVLGKKLSNFMPGDRFDKIEGAVREGIDGDKTFEIFESEFLNTLGRPVQVEISSSLVLKDDAPLGVLLTARDISERKKGDEERLKREKLQGVVEMAGAVCHELNQPMQSILGYIQLIDIDKLDDDCMAEKLLKINKAIRLMGSITRKIMCITRYETKAYLERQIIDIDQSSKTGIANK